MAQEYLIQALRNTSAPLGEHIASTLNHWEIARKLLTLSARHPSLHQCLPFPPAIPSPLPILSLRLDSSDFPVSGVRPGLLGGSFKVCGHEVQKFLGRGPAPGISGGSRKSVDGPRKAARSSLQQSVGCPRGDVPNQLSSSEGGLGSSHQRGPGTLLGSSAAECGCILAGLGGHAARVDLARLQLVQRGAHFPSSLPPAGLATPIRGAGKYMGGSAAPVYSCCCCRWGGGFSKGCVSLGRPPARLQTRPTRAPYGCPVLAFALPAAGWFLRLFGQLKAPTFSRNSHPTHQGAQGL